MLLLRYFLSVNTDNWLQGAQGEEGDDSEEDDDTGKGEPALFHMIIKPYLHLVDRPANQFICFYSDWTTIAIAVTVDFISNSWRTNSKQIVSGHTSSRWFQTHKFFDFYDLFLLTDDYGEEDDFDEWDEPSSSSQDAYNPINSQIAYSDDALSTTSSDVNRIGMPALVIYSFDVSFLNLNFR